MTTSRGRQPRKRTTVVYWHCCLVDPDTNGRGRWGRRGQRENTASILLSQQLQVSVREFIPAALDTENNTWSKCSRKQWWESEDEMREERDEESGGQEWREAWGRGGERGEGQERIKEERRWAVPMCDEKRQGRINCSSKVLGRSELNQERRYH